jgi:phosphoglucomutase
MFQNLIVEHQNGIAYITINRPLQLNALNKETIAELHSALEVADLAKEIAKKYNIEVIETLTGFKYIGEQIELNKGKTFIFGYEESFGFLIDTRVRDKDAFQPIPVLLNYVEELKKVNKTLVDELEVLFQEFGYYHDELMTFTFEGIEGQKKIGDTIQLLSKTPLGPFHGLTISQIENYQTLKKITISSIETLSLERSDVIKFHFLEGGWIVFRPSGTEPKLKIYLSLTAKDKINLLSRFSQFKERLLKSL